MSLEEQKNVTQVDPVADDNPLSSFEEVNDIPRRKNKLVSFLTSSAGIFTTLGVTLLLIVGIVLVIIFDPFAKPEPNTGDSNNAITEQTTITLLDKSKNSAVVINRVDIKNSNGSYSILYNEKEELFYLDGYADVLLGVDMIDTLQEYASKLIAIDQVKDANNLKDFGLDKPAATATVTFADKSTVTIQVGNPTPDEDGYYVQTSVKDGVYIFENDAALPFTYRQTEYVDVTLISTPSVLKDDANGTAVLKEISYSGKNYQTPFILRRSYQSDSEEMMLFSYIISQPYLRGTNDTATSALSNFTGLYADQALIIKPTEKEKEALGFHNPLTVMDIVMAVETTDQEDAEKIRYYNSTTSTVTIGSVEDDAYAVMVDGLDIIFLVDKASFSAIAERTYDNSVNSLLFTKNIVEIGRISITMNGETYDFNLKHFDTENSDTSLKVTVGDKTYPTADFRELYAILMTLERYGKTDKTASSDDAVMSIKMYHNDGSFYIGADYYSLDGSLCLVKTTEGEIYTTRWHYVTHFTEQVENYINGEKVLLLT